MGAERVISVLKTKPRVLRGIDYTFAGIFGAFAVRILATPGR
jgi:threonine/homoserine/homoserine lactone efflux protein